MSGKRLSILLKRDLAVDPVIEGVTADSRKVKPGYLFAALPGATADGRAYVSSGLAAGAAAFLTQTPLAIATGMSSILNGGVYRPLTLRKLAPGTAPSPGRQVLQESTSRTMLDLMRLNVTEGTGARADQLGLRVGGKTGTATKLVGGRYQEGKNVANLASFAAIFPTDGALGDDRYLVLIMMDAPKPNAADHGITTGAFTAAPVAGRVIDRIAPFVGVRRVIVTAELGAKPKPDAAALGANER